MTLDTFNTFTVTVMPQISKRFVVVYIIVDPLKSAQNINIIFMKLDFVWQSYHIWNYQLSFLIPKA